LEWQQPRFKDQKVSEREQLRQTILETVQRQHPTRLSQLSETIRQQGEQWQNLRDSDVRAIVQPRIGLSAFIPNRNPISVPHFRETVTAFCTQGHLRESPKSRR